MQQPGALLTLLFAVPNAPLITVGQGELPCLRQHPPANIETGNHFRWAHSKSALPLSEGMKPSRHPRCCPTVCTRLLVLSSARAAIRKGMSNCAQAICEQGVSSHPELFSMAPMSIHSDTELRAQGLLPRSHCQTGCKRIAGQCRSLS